MRIFCEDSVEVCSHSDRMARMMSRFASLLIVSFLAFSCRSPSPQVSVTPGAKLTGREIVLFEFGNAWVANHSMVRVLYQELARRGLAVKLELAPGETLPADGLILHLDHAGDTEEQAKGRIDFLSELEFSLRDASGKTLARASYSGPHLDKLEQKELGEKIADRLFAS